MTYEQLEDKLNWAEYSADLFSELYYDLLKEQAMNENQINAYDSKREKFVQYACDKLFEECFNYTKEVGDLSFDEWRKEALWVLKVPTWLSVDELLERTRHQAKDFYVKKKLEESEGQ